MLTKNVICAVIPRHEGLNVVASVLESEPLLVEGIKALFADLTADVRCLVAGTTVAHRGVVYVVLNAAGEAERQFILDSCAVTLDTELPMNSRLILVENADTLVEAGLLDIEAIPALEDCMIKVG